MVAKERVLFVSMNHRIECELGLTEHVLFNVLAFYLSFFSERLDYTNSDMDWIGAAKLSYAKLVLVEFLWRLNYLYSKKLASNNIGKFWR